MNMQPFPATGPLARNKDLTLRLLEAILKDSDGALYAHIVDTVRFDGGTFAQTGSAPNWQGDVLTLATCKHQMRSGIVENRWNGLWIAGFTGVETIPGHPMNYLVYVMRVYAAYASQRDLWFALPESVRAAKQAGVNRLGDLYRPLSTDGDPFDARVYEAPCTDHVHCTDYRWEDDIDYISIYGRRPPLLVGDIRHSFVWSKPLIAYPVGTHPRTKKHTLKALLSDLRHRPLHGQA